jgi:alpha-galactosidase
VSQRHQIEGTLKEGGLYISKVVTIDRYEAFKDFLVVEVTYTNLGEEFLIVNKWVNNSYVILNQGDTPPFWSFQGASYQDRRDWIKPLESGFKQENYMGMNASDYGGGIPVVDVWRKDLGFAVGHLSLVPKLVTLPVEVDEGNHVSVGVHFDREVMVEPGEVLKTLPTFVMIHQGDYYAALQKYTHIMQKMGLEFVESEEAAYESIWCAWGYEREFNTTEVLATLPKVKELGIKWAVLDDGYQIAEGDWDVNPKKFPGGDADMIKFVNTIHSYGLKAKLWWAPLAVDPGTQLLEQDPDIILLNDMGLPQEISWWDSYYMSPVYQGAIDHSRATVQKFLGEWGFDGLKMDGQHMNAVPPDYNDAHDLAYPEESVEQLPAFFKMIYQEARAIKPNAVIENCPCGTTCSFYNMAYMNQSVSSDPLSSWQIRHKGKTFKALMGRTAYYGDHVELSDNGNDFASSFGIGAVLGTKFTWPRDNPAQSESYLLTPEKELIWKKWFDLYHEKMLSKEPYLGTLYDIGYDKPETHVIQKDDILHYAFYAPSWDGVVEFRGLKPTNYTIYDYVNGVELGNLQGPLDSLTVNFKGSLLVEAVPD